MREGWLRAVRAGHTGGRSAGRRGPQAKGCHTLPLTPCRTVDGWLPGTIEAACIGSLECVAPPPPYAGSAATGLTVTS